MLKNTESSYGSMTRLLHWVMGIAIIAMLWVGLWMVDLPKDNFKWFVYDTHKATGVVILALLVFRIYWRRTNPAPLLPKGLPRFIEWASHKNILFLYLLMLIMPISGLAMSLMGGHPVSVYGLFTIPALSNGSPISFIGSRVHTVFGYVMIATLILHVSAALVHHFYFKDNVLRRIILGK